MPAAQLRRYFWSEDHSKGHGTNINRNQVGMCALSIREETRHSASNILVAQTIEAMYKQSKGTKTRGSAVHQIHRTLHPFGGGIVDVGKETSGLFGISPLL